MKHLELFTLTEADILLEAIEARLETMDVSEPDQPDGIVICSLSHCQMLETLEERIKQLFPNLRK